MLARLITLLALITTLPATSQAASRISPNDLDQARSSGDVELLIDIRSPQEFETGHIPGAVNIPAFALETRTIPAKRKVAIYSDGLGRIDENAALSSIRDSERLTILILSGGLAAWESAGLPTTHKKGLSQADSPIITFQQLKEIQTDGIVLADLRTTTSIRTTASQNSSDATPLSNLNDLFPGARIIQPEASRSAQASGTRRTGNSNSPELSQQLSSIQPASELIVLIDNGEGDRTAENTLRRLRAAGNKRVVILAGGESIIRREGRSGLSRVGHTLGEGGIPTPQSTNQ